MSDFVIKPKDGSRFGVDDVLVNPQGTLAKYLDRETHEIKSVELKDVLYIWRDRWGKDGGLKLKYQYHLD